MQLNYACINISYNNGAGHSLLNFFQDTKKITDCWDIAKLYWGYFRRTVTDLGLGYHNRELRPVTQEELRLSRLGKG